MEVRPWKRPVLLVLCALIVLGILSLGWIATGEQDLGERAAVVLGVLFGVIGAAIALLACDKCVARLLGNV